MLPVGPNHKSYASVSTPKFQVKLPFSATSIAFSAGLGFDAGSGVPAGGV